MSERRLREETIRKEAIAQERAKERLNQQIETKVDSMKRMLPNAPSVELEKIAVIMTEAEDRVGHADLSEPMRSLVSPRPDPPRIPQAIIDQKRRQMTPEEFEEWLAYELGGKQ